MLPPQHFLRRRLYENRADAPCLLQLLGRINGGTAGSATRIVAAARLTV